MNPTPLLWATAAMVAFWTATIYLAVKVLA